jgi:hypothetical protein
MRAFISLCCTLFSINLHTPSSLPQDCKKLMYSALARPLVAETLNYAPAIGKPLTLVLVMHPGEQTTLNTNLASRHPAKLLLPSVRAISGYQVVASNGLIFGLCIKRNMLKKLQSVFSAPISPDICTTNGNQVCSNI